MLPGRMGVRGTPHGHSMPLARMAHWPPFGPISKTHSPDTAPRNRNASDPTKGGASQTEESDTGYLDGEVHRRVAVDAHCLDGRCAARLACACLSGHGMQRRRDSFTSMFSATAEAANQGREFDDRTTTVLRSSFRFAGRIPYQVGSTCRPPPPPPPLSPATHSTKKKGVRKPCTGVEVATGCKLDGHGQQLVNRPLLRLQRGLLHGKHPRKQSKVNTSSGSTGHVASAQRGRHLYPADLIRAWLLALILIRNTDARPHRRCRGGCTGWLIPPEIKPRPASRSRIASTRGLGSATTNVQTKTNAPAAA